MSTGLRFDSIRYSPARLWHLVDSLVSAPSEQRAPNTTRASVDRVRVNMQDAVSETRCDPGITDGKIGDVPNWLAEVRRDFCSGGAQIDARPSCWFKGQCNSVLWQTCTKCLPLLFSGA